jgi:hypothetical protein
MQKLHSFNSADAASEPGSIGRNQAAQDAVEARASDVCVSLMAANVYRVAP